ncbi:DsbA family protein [Lolliginicoccus levis]|uniref:DsbA family protein n=1 Tax=Lolliginicoccus levis TaxID=2919542 RepID=UPI00241DDE02|nr:thioredoxin domain-containing protein [Lolliginicoccus levis]
MSNRPSRGLITQQKARDQRRAMLRRTAITALIIVVVVGAVIFIISQRTDDSTEATINTEVVEPSGTAITDDAGIAFGPEDAEVTVAVYEDFLCPVCKQFEDLSGETLRDLASSGEARVVYHPIAILDRLSSTAYSSRAASAAFCVAEHGSDQWLDWQLEMYAQQPAEGGAGLPNDEIADMAASAGADSPELQQCIADATYQGYALQATDDALAAGVQGTPTVMINGEPAENLTPEGLREAVDAARG